MRGARFRLGDLAWHDGGLRPANGEEFQASTWMLWDRFCATRGLARAAGLASGGDPAW